MPQLQQLLDKRANVWSQYQEALDDVGDNGFSAEQTQKLDRMEAELQQLSSSIERIKRSEGLDPTGGGDPNEVVRDGVPGGDQRGQEGTGTGADPDAGQPGDDAYNKAFVSFLRSGINGVDSEQRSLLERRFVANGDELRAQGIATDAAGGYLVPEGFRRKITETMKFFGGMRQVAGGIRTASGQSLPWPSNDDTANEGAYLAENTQASEQDTTFGQKTLGAHMITSGIVRASFQLLNDADFGQTIEDFLGRKLGERIGRRENRAFTVGTGTAQPEGVQTNVTVGKTGAGGQTTSVTYDDLVDLEHSVDVAYRNERARWMFHDLTLASLRKVKDNDGRPLWQPAAQAGAPDLINGRPYTVNNDMPQMAANAVSILFGDFEAGYVIRDVSQMGLLRLQERYADFLQVGFLAFARHDGVPDDGAAIRGYQNAAA